jgi:ribonuclease P protein component
MKRFGFAKNEHLVGRKTISNLFENGKSVMISPLRAVFCKTEEHKGAKILVAASKKQFKRAVVRNYHKRLLRENYRLNKHIINDFLADKNFGLDIALSIVSSEKQNFSIISVKIIEILKKIVVNLQ